MCQQQNANHSRKIHKQAFGREEIGNEYHYLFKCSKFNEERIKYIKEYFINNPSEDKMKKLFNESSRKQLLNLAKFVYEVMQVFKN